MGPFQQQCSAAFGVTPEQTYAAVAFNSANYGDNKPGGSRIAFINGDIDPFHYGGVTKNSSALLAQDITAYMVAGGSHCADMGSLDPERDSPSMASVKRSKAAAIERWLAEEPAGDLSGADVARGGTKGSEALDTAATAAARVKTDDSETDKVDNPDVGSSTSIDVELQQQQQQLQRHFQQPRRVPEFPIAPTGVRTQEWMRHVGTQNCTWRNISQPIDHFGSPKGTYEERYCIYDQFYDKSKPAGPIVGNESPVTLYINASGLMWEHGKELNAVLVWAEHRFEGTSFPNLTSVPDCAVAGTSAQALADYIALIKMLKDEYGGPGMPVIAFGGSYGGMLAAWIRIRYPKIITGAIAASAPVITKNTTTKDVLQGGFYAISRGMEDKADGIGVAGKHCFSNYRASQVLLPILARNDFAMAEMAKGVRMCAGHPAQKTISPSQILGKIHAPMFGFGEANYPFPQLYRDFAIVRP